MLVLQNMIVMSNDNGINGLRKSAHRNASRQGLTLIETLIAIFLLGLFVAGSVRVLTVLRRSSDMSRLNYQAINIAKDRIERVRAFDFHQLDAANEQGTLLGDGLFRRSTIITNAFVNDNVSPPAVITTNTPTGLKQISVIVETLNQRTRRFDGPQQTLNTMIAATEVEP